MPMLAPMGSASPQTPLKRLDSLQSLRGLAAFLVLIFHIVALQREALPANSVDELKLLSGFWDRGYVGVDLFFVISGFIMVYVTRNIGRSRREIVGFLKSRITRVYPLWWVFAGLMALYFLIAYGVPADPFRISGPKEVTSYLFKSFLLIPQEHVPVLGVGWSLIHEVYFYLIFALILCLPRKFLIPALSFWTVVVFILFAAGFARPMVNSVSALMGSLLTLEFIGGALVGYLVVRGENRGAVLASILGAAGLILGMLLYTETGTNLTMWGRVAVFAPPCMALIYGLTSLEGLGKFKMPSLIVSIGDWSYSLYLSHILVLSAIKRIYPKVIDFLPEPMADVLTLGAPGALDNLVLALVGILVSLVFAAFSYRFLERPLIAGSRKVFGKKKAVS